MAGNAAYTVDHKEESFEYINKKLVTSWRIWAISTGGTRFHIDVLDSDLDKAPLRLTAKAQELDAIV